MRRALLAVVFATLAVGPACRGGSAAEESTATAQPSATAAAPSATATATASPTPDPLARVPQTQPEALAWVQSALNAAEAGKCPDAVVKAGGACSTGDATGDGIPEVAILLPVKPGSATAPHPSAVFIRASQTEKVVPFAEDLTADASALGLGFFALADRTGDGRPDLSYVQNICGATGCNSRAVVLAWDGTAWRDIGPGDSVANIDEVTWTGAGGSSVLSIHGGKLPPAAPPESGPTRASTTRYAFTGGRYTTRAVEKDPPEYLYQLVEDANDAFEADMAGSQAIYRKVIDGTALKDWKLKPEDADRRPALIGFALFRLALIDAALGRDPTAALDRVIRDSKEPLFVYLAEAFRNGYQVRGGVVGGCAEANLYLRTPQGAGTDPGSYVAQLFNYGYANPPGSKWIAKLCPF